MVSVEEGKSPKHLWRLGKVTRLFPGKDGQTRSAVVRVQSGKGGTTELNRLIQRLYPIKVSGNQKDCEEHFIKVVKDRDIPVVVTAS